MRHWLPLFLLVGLLSAVGTLAEETNPSSREADGAPASPADLPAQYQQWLEDVALLLSDAEREAFLALRQDYRRDAFIERFWRLRDPYPESTRNERQLDWDARLNALRILFQYEERDPRDERYEVLLLNGQPTRRCRYLRVPDELWYYDYSEMEGQPFFVFLREIYDGGPLQIVRPGLQRQLGGPFGTRPLRLSRDLDIVCNGEDFFLYGEWLEDQSADSLHRLYDRITSPPEPPNLEWISGFLAASTELPEGAERFDATLSVEFPGRHRSRTVLQGLVAIAPEALVADDHALHNLRLTGELLQGGKLFDQFAYTFHLPAADAGSTVPVAFERRLRAGPYTLLLKIEDLNGGRFWYRSQAVTVPATVPLSTPTVVSATAPDLGDSRGRGMALQGLLEEARAVAQGDRPILRLIRPTTNLMAGLQRFATLTGGGIDRVRFLLDDRPIFTKLRPPFTVELDLGELPQAQVLRVEGYGPDSEEILASDELLLNPGGQTFRVRLLEPRRDRRYERSLPVEAEVTLPGERLGRGEPEDGVAERVEIYLDETLVATLHQPPYTQALRLPNPGELAYVRAVATLHDGHQTEDVVFVNAPPNMTEVRVDLVELYISVRDRQQRPVEGLPETAFQVREDGVAQRPVRFTEVRDLPIHIGLLLDTSGSMEDLLGETQGAVRDFLDRALQPKDRVALVTFNDRPRLTVELTGDRQALDSALTTLQAAGGTALNDGLVFMLYYLTGIRGQRAVLLLSDGADESSRFTEEATLELVRNAGVTVYTIGLKGAAGSRRARRHLERLAEESGGRAFLLEDPTQLTTVYQTIEEELRSRYFLAYQSTNDKALEDGGGDFREVRVEVEGSGLTATTMRGYVP
jgi:Ca-activated chloride channel homolog